MDWVDVIGLAGGIWGGGDKVMFPSSVDSYILLKFLK
jgi:hypothetical protein